MSAHGSGRRTTSPARLLRAGTAPGGVATRVRQAVPGRARARVVAVLPGQWAVAPERASSSRSERRGGPRRREGPPPPKRGGTTGKRPPPNRPPKGGPKDPPAP